MLSSQCVCVKGMERLAKLQHDVVGGVCDIVDRSDAKRLQPGLQPIGRWSDLHTFDVTATITRTEIRVGDGDREDFLRGLFGFPQCELWRPQHGSIDSAGFTGDSQMTEAIRPIRRNLQLKDRVSIGGLERLHRQADVREPDGELRRRLWDIDEFFKPIETDSHPCNPRRPRLKTAPEISYRSGKRAEGR